MFVITTILAVGLPIVVPHPFDPAQWLIYAMLLFMGYVSTGLLITTYIDDRKYIKQRKY